MSWISAARTLPLVVCILAAPAVRAQIERDGSLGTGTIGPGLDDLNQPATYLIEEEHGDRSGQNLFHSFSQFSVGIDEIATFTATDSTNNVIGRVTGGLRSDINGTLRSTIPGADLYLLNPSGVFFGRESAVDVRGSLFLSTAEVLRFGDAAFDARAPTPSPLLSSDPPTAFGFLSDQPARIEFSLVKGLEVPESHTFSLVGGELLLSGRGEDTFIARNGTIQLASASAPIDIPVQIEELDLDPLESGQLGEITAIPRVQFNVSSPDAADAPTGTVLIRGGRFVLGGNILVSNTSDIDATAPVLDAELLESFDLTDFSVVASQAKAGGRSGDLRIRAPRVALAQGSIIQTASAGMATSGSLMIEAPQELVLKGGDLGAALVQSVATDGQGGPIEIHAGELTLTGSAIVSLGLQDGQGGPIGIHADTIQLRDNSEIASRAQGSRPGGALQIAGEGHHIPARLVDVGDGSRIETTSEADGDGATLSITADTVVVAAGTHREEVTSISTQTSSASTRPGGELTIETRELHAIDGGQIFTSTRGIGRAGDLRVVSADLVRVSGLDDKLVSQINSRSLGDGDGGDVRIDARVVEVENQGLLTTATQGRGNAGDLRIEGAERVTVRGGPDGFALISAATLPPGDAPDFTVGEGGALFIDAQIVEALNGGQLTVSASGTGNAGNLTIHDAGTVTVAGFDPLTGDVEAGIFAQSLGSAEVIDPGDGGSISITARSLEVREGGLISVATKGEGRAGSIALNIGDELVVSGGEISARSERNANGDVGSIQIRGARLVRVDSEGKILAESQLVDTQLIPSSPSESGSILITRVQDVQLSTESSISARAFDTRDGGDISIIADGDLALSGAEITTEAAEGKGGDITMLALGGDVVLADESEVTARAFGAGDAGAVTIGARRNVLLTGGSSANAETFGSGQGGAIVVGANGRVELLDRSLISALSTGPGNAGDIDIQAGQDFRARGSAVTTEATQAFGGNISIAATNIVHLDNSEVTTSVQTGEGAGGNIVIAVVDESGNIVDVPRFVVLDESRVIANAELGTAGNITIASQQFLQSHDSLVEATNELGIPGNIVTTSPDTTLVGQLASLPSDFLDAAALLTGTCAERTAPAGSFVVRGRDAIPAAPDAPLGSFYPGGFDTSRFADESCL